MFIDKTKACNVDCQDVKHIPAETLGKGAMGTWMKTRIASTCLKHYSSHPTTGDASAEILIGTEDLLKAPTQ